MQINVADQFDNTLKKMEDTQIDEDFQNAETPKPFSYVQK